MTKNESYALEAIQTIYFDICDMLNGSTYIELGYDNKRDFLLNTQAKLTEIENRLFPVTEEVRS